MTDSNIEHEGCLDEHKYTHRVRGIKARRHLALRYYKELEYYYQYADPIFHSGTVEGKDFAARNALMIIRFFTELMAGWAVDHAIGKAICYEGLLPAYDPATRRSPEYREMQMQADRHEHELRGSSVSGGSDIISDYDPKISRQVLLNLAEVNSMAMPREMAAQIAGALRALSFGEVLPEFRPDPGNYAKKKMLQLQAQMKAIEHVEFRACLGIPRNRAEETVSGSYGVAVNTLKSWKNRIRKGLDSIYVDFRLQHSRNMAANYVGKPSEIGMDDVRSIEQEYGERALMRDGKAFQELERNVKAHRSGARKP